MINSTMNIALSGMRVGATRANVAAHNIANVNNASRPQQAEPARQIQQAAPRQIEQGAPADIFISANVEWMDHLQERGRVEAAQSVDLLGNSLVLIGREAEPDLHLGDAARFGEGRIAMGLTKAVPAGIYGRAALERLGLWEPLKARVVETDNVRAALALVARGEARYGIVYASDAVAEPKVQVLLSFPEDSHRPIVYPAARLTQNGAATFAFLQSEAAWAQFAAQGFLRIEARP